MKHMLSEVNIICCKTSSSLDASIFDTLAVNIEKQIYKNNDSIERSD